MNQQKLEERVKKKVQLGGKALDQALAPDEMALISFWSQMENRATDRKTKLKKEPERHPGVTEKQIDDEIEAEGQKVLDQFNGNGRQALDSLI